MIVNVVDDFGAKGDGRFDDSAAFIAALSSEADRICVPGGLHMNWSLSAAAWEMLQTNIQRIEKCEGDKCPCHAEREEFGPWYGD